MHQIRAEVLDHAEQVQHRQRAPVIDSWFFAWVLFACPGIRTLFRLLGFQAHPLVSPTSWWAVWAFVATHGVVRMQPTVVGVEVVMLTIV